MTEENVKLPSVALPFPNLPKYYIKSYRNTIHQKIIENNFPRNTEPCVYSHEYYVVVVVK